MISTRRLLLLAVGVAILASHPRPARSEDEDWLKLGKQGAAHFMLQDFPQAIRCWERAIALKPGIYGLHGNLAKAYFRLGRYRESLAQSERAIAIGIPTVSEANVWGDIGLCHRRLKNFTKAVEAQTRARDREPTSARHWFNLANAISEAGRREEAIAAWEECLELDPTNAETAEALEDEKRQLAFAPRPLKSGVAEVNASRVRSAWLDLDGALEALRAGGRNDPAIKTEIEEIEARAEYLAAIGAAAAPGTTLVVSENGKRLKLKRASAKGLEVEGETDLLPWHIPPRGVVATLVAATDKSVKTAALGAILVLYDLGLWALADQRIKTWVDAEPGAAARAFDILARYRGLPGPPEGGFRWTGSEWLTPPEEEARARDLVTVDGETVPRADARRIIEKQRTSRRIAKRSQVELARTRAEKLRAEKGVTDVRTILSSGDPLKRADVVVVADGFTSTELAAFERLADVVAKAVLTVEPYQSYARYVNVHRVSVVAEESGPAGSRVGAKVDAGGTLTCDRGLAAEYGNFAPDADLVIVCVNVKEARATGSPGLITIDASGEFNEVVLHELGHALAGLDDEYADPSLVGQFPDYDESQEPGRLRKQRVIHNPDGCCDYYADGCSAV